MHHTTFRGFALAVFVWIASCPMRAEGPGADLKWKFRNGQVLRQVMEMEILTTMKFGGQTQKVSQKMNLDLRYTVNKLSPDGVASMTQKTVHLALKIGMPGGQTFEFDSKSPGDLKGPLAEALGPLLKALSDSEARLEMAPTGKIESMKLSEEVRKALQASPSASSMGELFSEESLKLMCSCWPVFDSGPISVGKSSSINIQHKMPFGSMHTDHEYTYAGPEKKGDRELHRFDIKTTYSAQKGSPEGPDLRVKPGESSGALYFDAAAGRVAEVTQKHEMTLEVPGAFESTTASTVKCTIDEVTEITPAADKKKTQQKTEPSEK